jgi:hypothetical protein
MDKLTKALWVRVKTVVGRRSSLPTWMQSLLSLPLEALVAEGIEVHVERKTVDESYLEFLERQIALGARGPGWTAVLTSRRDALKAHVGKRVTTVTFLKGHDGFVVRLLEAPEHCLLHCETQ